MEFIQAQARLAVNRTVTQLVPSNIRLSMYASPPLVGTNEIRRPVQAMQKQRLKTGLSYLFRTMTVSLPTIMTSFQTQDLST